MQVHQSNRRPQIAVRSEQSNVEQPSPHSGAEDPREVVVLSGSDRDAPRAAGSRILMMVPDNFMWPEFAEPYQAYKEAGAAVTIATTDGDQARPDKRNYAQYENVKVVDADLSFKQVKLDDYDAITTVGGTGALAFNMDDTAQDIVDGSLDSGKLTGLICASTSLLAAMHNYDGQHSQVTGRTATGYHKVERELRGAGIQFIDGAKDEVTVVIDGNLVTGRNQQSSRLFGETVLQQLAQQNAGSTEEL